MFEALFLFVSLRCGILIRDRAVSFFNVFFSLSFVRIFRILSNSSGANALTKVEYLICRHLIDMAKMNVPLPAKVPSELIESAKEPSVWMELSISLYLISLISLPSRLSTYRIFPNLSLYIYILFISLNLEVVSLLAFSISEQIPPSLGLNSLSGGLNSLSSGFSPSTFPTSMSSFSPMMNAPVKNGFGDGFDDDFSASNQSSATFSTVSLNIFLRIFLLNLCSIHFILMTVLYLLPFLYFGLYLYY